MVAIEVLRVKEENLEKMLPLPFPWFSNVWCKNSSSFQFL